MVHTTDEFMALFSSDFILVVVWWAEVKDRVSVPAGPERYRSVSC